MTRAESDSAPAERITAYAKLHQLRNSYNSAT